MRERELTDPELVRRCLEEDREAWELLVQRYGKLVYAIALRAGLSADDGADVFQTVLVTAYRNLHLLDRPESLPHWLSTIARRESWQAKRRLARAGHEAAAGAPEVEVASAEPLADEELERLQTKAMVQRGLDRVDERCRRLLHLLFFSDPAPSYEDAARSLGVPLGSIGPTRGRCLEKLRKALRDIGF